MAQARVTLLNMSLPPVDNPDLHPLFESAQALDLPILIHGGVLRSPNVTSRHNPASCSRHIPATFWGSPEHFEAG